MGVTEVLRCADGLFIGLGGKSVTEDILATSFT